MDLGLKGKVALVTAGGVGIGKAIAYRLAKEGVSVAICQRRLAVVEATAKEIERETGSRVLPVAVDTTNDESVRAAVQRVVDEFGRIDVLVNGAAHPGGLVRNDLEGAEADGLLKDIDVKVIGYFRCAKEAAPYMKKSGFGRIINIGGLTARGSKVLSGMRNAAICHMTKVLSDQLGPHGITVNVIHPGVVETEHIHELYEKEAQKQGLTPKEVEMNYVKATPIRRIIKAEEIGYAVAFLVSPLAGSITGESLAVDGGITRGIFI